MNKLLMVLFFLVPSGLFAQGANGAFKPEAKFYGIGAWDADSLGNHRVVIEVQTKSDAVRAHIPWRRRDARPEQKNVIIIDAATGKRITNVRWTRMNREAGDVVFQPQTAPGKYYLYYLVYKSIGSRNYPKGYHQQMERTADDAWLKRVGLDQPSNLE
jgi:hypothetical protein